MTPAIELQHVSKAYTLGEAARSLRDAAGALARAVLHRRKDNGDRILWALKDVTFQVRPGEAVGIIGPNGAGKTTILKLLSNVTQCTAGSVAVNGRVASLIELGAGFHPDLTGRENIFLNGAILGMSRRTTRERFDEIVEFSGLKRFLDTPVKRYSSGMYARLGFSVAAHTGADVLLVDEVLAVGDVAFQAKSVKRMRELVAGGVAVIFVSHSLYYVNYFCDRAILLDQGRVRTSGPPGEVIEAYQRLLHQARSAEDAATGGQAADSATPDSPARIAAVRIFDADRLPRDEFNAGESLVVQVTIVAKENVEHPVLEFAITSEDGVLCYSTHNRADGVLCPTVTGDYTVEIEFPEIRLLPGSYSLSVRLFESSAIGVYDRKDLVRTFRISRSPSDSGVENGLFYLPHRWKID